uniref:RING-type domain-containing protein n=1 Tax=Physcomitrium patens TaxID=3218 RepID=A0A2K1L3G4_PHYPA|nr:hypothetical protein PHYPA_003365 [Physcomitrium patens]
MESSGSGSEVHRSNGASRRYGMQLSSANFLPGPVSALLELTGLLRGRGNASEGEQAGGASGGSAGRSSEGGRGGDGGAEVSIRIFGVGESEPVQVSSGPGVASARNGTGSSSPQSVGGVVPMRIAGNESSGSIGGSTGGSVGGSIGHASGGEERGEGLDNEAGGNGREGGSQRYDFQQLARWIEQVLPFTILLLMVFIRQHLQGFFVVFWITAVMFKANDVLRKQTALKNERKPGVLVAVGWGLVVHVIGVYWWYSGEALWRPLVLFPPREIPPFWDAIFIIVVNDTVARQAAMVFKCGVLIWYKDIRGRNYRRQAQLLTLVEYVLLLYRALLPGPVWYRFFLNKSYGNLFSSLTTGLYLTFKLTSSLEKVQTFLAALRALSRREVQYGAYATSEEVLASGDMCALCPEKKHASDIAAVQAHLLRGLCVGMVREGANVSVVPGRSETGRSAVVWGRIDEPVHPVVLEGVVEGNDGKRVQERVQPR